MKKTLLLFCVTIMMLTGYAQSYSESDLLKDGILKSEGITLLANDYEGGVRHEKVKPRIVNDPADENNKCIVITTNSNFENRYDAQLFITAQEPFKEGERVKFSMLVKADKAQTFTSDVHYLPGEYHMPLSGNIIITEWITVMASFVVEEPNLKTIALNLSDIKSGNNCYFREIYLVRGFPEVFDMSDFKASGKQGSHEYVDLGLSVKWATVNIGAEIPNNIGNYYAWGEVEPKNRYSWSSYKLCNGVLFTLKKYCPDTSLGSKGYSDNKTVLDAEDDVAHVSWGDKWRMPTADEFRELMDNCTWTWGTLNGVLGHKMTSKKNGKSIFLPEGDFYMDDNFYNKATTNESGGYYWCSSLDPDNPTYAQYLCFGMDFNILNTRERYYGRTVRAVHP